MLMGPWMDGNISIVISGFGELYTGYVRKSYLGEYTLKCLLQKSSEKE